MDLKDEIKKRYPYLLRRKFPNEVKKLIPKFIDLSSQNKNVIRDVSYKVSPRIQTKRKELLPNSVYLKDSSMNDSRLPIVKSESMINISKEGHSISKEFNLGDLPRSTRYNLKNIGNISETQYSQGFKIKKEALAIN